MQLNKIRSKIKSINPFILASVSGILLAVSFPSFNYSFLIWVSLTPLLIALENTEGKTAFWIGYTQGLIFTLISLFWIKIFHVLALPGMLLVFSIYFGIFAWLYTLLRKHFHSFKPWLAPLIWVSIEYLRSIGFLGFAWNCLGYSQYKNIYLIQFADYTGVAGVSFLIVFTNACLMDIFFNEKSQIKYYWINTVLIMLAFFYGYFSLNKKTESTRSLKIGIIQGNFDARMYNDYIKLSTLKKLSSKFSGLDLEIYTETVLMENLLNNFMIRNEVENIARQNNSFILIGNPVAESSPDNTVKDFNSVYLINPEGSFLQRYDKMHLVPFGEVFPFHNSFDFIREWEKEVDCGGFEPGKERVVFELKDKNRKAYFSTIICFEAVFGDLTRKFVKDGAQFLVNITNDSWSYSTASHYQHAIMSIFRAIENRVYFVRAANTGVSFIIDPYGRILRKLDVFKQGILEDKIYLKNKNDLTFYSKYGDVFSQICVGILLIFVTLYFINCKLN